MDDQWEDAELARRFLEATATKQPRAPLYAALAAGVASDPELHGLLQHAPPTQRLPVLLFAATHYMLLAEPDHELATWYPNLTEQPRSPDDTELVPTFKNFITDRTPALVDLLATRTVQTNEIGRCLLLMPALAAIGREVGTIGHLDVGTSGGLTLLSDRFDYRYEPDDGGSVTTISAAVQGITDPEAATDATATLTTTAAIVPAATNSAAAQVVLTASTRGALVLPDHLPTIGERCGIDVNPIDVTNDVDALWLEACVWPDQRERFLRLRSAIEIARRHPPEIIAGDAVDSVALGIDRVGSGGHPVATTSWVMNYLAPARRTAFVAELDRIGAERDVSWVFAESPVMAPELPWESGELDNDMTVLSVARWRSGRRTVEHLATCHPHGFWLHARQPGQHD